MSKIALKMVEEIQLSWEYGQTFHPYSIILLSENYVKLDTISDSLFDENVPFGV